MINKVGFGQRPLRYLIILGLLLPLLLPSQRVYACSCAPPASPEMALQGATAVFSGKVTDVTTGLSSFIKSSNFDSGTKIGFSITEVWKGEPYETIIINTSSSGASCGLEGISEGAEWLVYAYGQQEFLSSNLCTRTRPLISASDDLAILGKGNAPAIAGANEPLPDSGFAWVLGSCTAVIPLLAVTFLLIKRRRQAGRLG